MARMPTDYSKLEKDIDLLDRDDLLSIELNAGALNIEQCLDALGIEIKDVSEAEMVTIKRVHKLGSAKSIANAFVKLNSAMGAKNGGQLALELLRIKCDDFSVEQSELPKSGSGFSFNVSIPVEDKA